MNIPIVFGTIITIAFLFNGARRNRNSIERWTTRERSHGWPYYWKVKQQMWACPQNEALWKALEDKAFNRYAPITRVCKNIIYLE